MSRANGSELKLDKADRAPDWRIHPVPIFLFTYSNSNNSKKKEKQQQ